jgi:hypothetical protein
MTAAVVGAGSAILAGTLLCAGTAKLAVPAHLSRAIGELVPLVEARSVLLARLVAVVEIGVALALSVPAARDVGAAAAAALGCAFAVAGGVAATRGIGAPCGCFGRAGARPLGVRHLAFGLFVTVVSALLLRDGSGGWSAYPGLPMLGTTAVAVVLAGWVYRDLIKDLGPYWLRGRRGSATERIG